MGILVTTLISLIFVLAASDVHLARLQAFVGPNLKAKCSYRQKATAHYANAQSFVNVELVIHFLQNTVNLQIHKAV